MASARASSGIVDYCPLGSSMIDCVYQGLYIHSIWILSINLYVITRTEDPYLIVHLVYHGNFWLIKSHEGY